MQDLLTSYKAMGCNMILKIHFLELNLHFFFPEISAKSVTNTVKDFAKSLWLWKSGTKASGLQADYCWTLKRDVPDAKCRRVIRLYILEECFYVFYEDVKYYFAHLNSSVSLKPCLIDKFCKNI